MRPDENGLKHPLVPDRGGQFLQIVAVEDLPRLIRVGPEAFYRGHLDAGGRGSPVDCRALGHLFSEKCGEASTQTAIL
jgi:hypothetical protein